MYHKQAINLADELTTFVTAETIKETPEKATGYRTDQIKATFLFLLKDLFLCDDVLLIEEARLSEVLGLDSLDLVELVMNCEREFGICLQDSEWIPLRTIGEWLELMAEKSGGNPGDQ